MPPVGTLFCASIGETLIQSATGIKHGVIRSATVGEILRNGGTVTLVPELDPRVGIINRQHLEVVEGGITTTFGPPLPNPVLKERRFGGRDFVDQPLPWEGNAP